VHISLSLSPVIFYCWLHKLFLLFNDLFTFSPMNFAIGGCAILIIDIKMEALARKKAKEMGIIRLFMWPKCITYSEENPFFSTSKDLLCSWPSRLIQSTFQFTLKKISFKATTVSMATPLLIHYCGWRNFLSLSASYLLKATVAHIISK